MNFIPSILLHDEYSVIDKEALALLAIANLHMQTKISDSKLKGMLKRLRDGKFLRYVNTHHSNINDKWYNDDSMLTILIKIHDEVCSPAILSLDDYLKYVNLLKNANKNYCIDYVFKMIIEPLVNNIRSYSSLNQLKSFDIPFEYMTYEEADRRYGLSDGYCCDDCDGSYSEYKMNKYEYYYRNRDVIIPFKEYLRSQKTHLKNPIDILK